MFHASLLTPYHENDIHGVNDEELPPDLVEGQQEWEIEKITRHRRKGNQWQYFIKWKGYPTSDNSWEPETNLENARDLLQEYKDKHKLQ